MLWFRFFFLSGMCFDMRLTITLLVVPVYDGRNGVFDCNSFASSLAALHPYPLDRDSQFEIPEGSGCLVGYTVSTSKYLSTWRLTFHLLWVIVLAD